MKRKFLATLAMLIIVLTGAFSPVIGLFIQPAQVQIVHAQEEEWEVGASSTSAEVTSDTTTDRDISAETVTTRKEDGGKEKDKEPLNCGINIICGFVVLYSYFVKYLPHLLATVTGMVLDFTLYYNLQSSTWTSQDQQESFVVRGWSFVRDFCNLLFIFSLFVVAFSLILSGAEGSKPLFDLDPKRTIARVILMALLINFSFFMSRVVIDITNLFGNVFYQKITVLDVKNEACKQTSEVTDGGTDKILGGTECFYSGLGGIRSVSLGILGSVNPQKLMQGAGADFSGISKSGIGFITYGAPVYITLIFISTMVGVFDFFLVYLFLSSTIFLAARVLGLYFLIILSPIAFVSTVIPSFQKKEWFGFNDWFKQLIGLSFSLPIYLFFLWLGVFFININSPIERPGITGALAVSGIILFKLITIGFVLIVGKNVSKDLSGRFGAMASGAVTSIVTGAVMVAGAAVTGGASAALQMSGRLAGQAAASTARGVGGAVLGDEKAQQLEKWIRTPGNAMKRLNNFNPARDMHKAKTAGEAIGQFGKNIIAATGEAARMSGSTVPDELAQAFRVGKLTPRMEDIKKASERVQKAKAAKELADKEKTKSVDKEIAQLNKDKEEGLIYGKEYEEKKKELALKKKNILNPNATELAAVNNASENLKTAKEGLPAKNKKLDEDIMSGQKKLTSLNDQLTKNAAALTLITEKITDIETKELDAQKKAADKRASIKNAEDFHNTRIRDLGIKRDVASKAISPIDDEIKSLDFATGLAVNQKDLNDLRVSREALLAKKRGAETALLDVEAEIKNESASHNTNVTAMTTELNAIIAQQNTLAAEHQKEIARRSELNKDATKTYDSVASVKAQLDTDIAARISSDVELNNLESALSKAKDNLKVAQEKTWVTEELNNRSLFENKDTVNATRNADRVKKLNDYLTTITAGGAKTIDPHAKKLDF